MICIPSRARVRVDRLTKAIDSLRREIIGIDAETPFLGSVLGEECLGHESARRLHEEARCNRGGPRPGDSSGRTRSGPVPRRNHAGACALAEQGLDSSQGQEIVRDLGPGDRPGVGQGRTDLGVMAKDVLAGKGAAASLVGAGSHGHVPETLAARPGGTLTGRGARPSGQHLQEGRFGNDPDVGPGRVEPLPPWFVCPPCGRRCTGESLRRQ